MASKWLALGEVSIQIEVWSCETCGTVRTHSGEPGACPVCELRSAIEKKGASPPKGTNGHRRVVADPIWGAEVRKARKELNLTLDEIARSVGLAGSDLSRIERGLQGTRDEIRTRINEELGIEG